jgi:hypothetical protein
VYVVLEKLQNGMRIWSKHRDKSFLPKDFTRDTPSINPFVFNLNETPLSIERDIR